MTVDIPAMALLVSLEEEEEEEEEVVEVVEEEVMDGIEDVVEVVV